MSPFKSLFEIWWTAYVYAKNIERAELLSRRIETILQLPIQIYSIQQYWKDWSQFEICFATPQFESKKEEALYQTLHVADLLAWEWRITKPFEDEQGNFEFQGISEKTKLSAVSWVSFQLIKVQNKPMNMLPIDTTRNLGY